MQFDLSLSREVILTPFCPPNSNPSEGVEEEGVGLDGLLVVVGEVPPRPTCRPGGGQSHQSQPENITEEKVRQKFFQPRWRLEGVLRPWPSGFMPYAKEVHLARNQWSKVRIGGVFPNDVRLLTTHRKQAGLTCDF